MYFLLALLLIAFIVLYFIATSDVAVSYKFIFAVAEMVIVGAIMKKMIKPSKNYWIDGEWGLLLLKTKKGLGTIDKIAKNKKLWNFLTDVGIFACYGFFSLFFLKNHFTKQTGFGKKTLNYPKILLGILFLVFISIFIAPYSVQILVTTIKGQTIPVESVEKASENIFLPWISAIITFGFGIFGVIFAGLIQSGFFIIEKLFGMLSGISQLTQKDAGVTLIIPGMNLPLVEGIIALFVILLVHEGAHAILGRVAKISLHSAGLVLFGSIPIGAFVEPDEESLKKLDCEKQTRVIAAGPCANFMFAGIFFLLLLGFMASVNDFRETEGLLVISGMDSGTIIYSVNGEKITDGLIIEANQKTFLNTSKGELEIISNSDGKIGVLGYYLDGSSIVRYKHDWMNFIYITLGLIFSLNFVIGAVNLLPIPIFDGNRIMEINMKYKPIVKILTYIAVCALLLNFLPWLF
ncbi:MAG: site-2 protease family protein [Candidatus Micrarchaeia archaeon]